MQHSRARITLALLSKQKQNQARATQKSLSDLENVRPKIFDVRG
jgi:hypothetical protein